MPSDDSQTLTSGREAVRHIVGWCADVHEANPHAVMHDGPCGLRYYCPNYRSDGYRRAEVLRNGTLVFHCEGLTLSRTDSGYAERRAGLAE